MPITIQINGKKIQAEKGAAIQDIAKKEFPGREYFAAKVDKELSDLSRQLENDSAIELLDFGSKEGIEVFRHSSAHLLAQAVTELYPEAKLTIGPVVEEGFYYDIDMQPLTPEDLEKIEQKMHEILKRNDKIVRKEVSSKEAQKLFKDNPYKQELIKEYGEGKLSVYEQGSFYDLCRGPHLPRTGLIKAFKLTKIAGAYWRGDPKNKQLQRIYGISFPERELLKSYLALLAEAEKRDHRKLGQQLELFSFHDEAPGMPFFHPHGMVVWNELVGYAMEKRRKEGFLFIKTPILLNRTLWETSGHWENYKDNMYTLKIDSSDVAVKPMNCPGSILLYKEKIHSYRELPLRLAEIGLVHRHELSGVLSGLFRVRAFHQDDAHIFLAEKQLKEEIKKLLRLADEIYQQFGLNYHLELSTRPAKSIGTDEQWNTATSALKGALEENKRQFKINEGDGAFYGPKIDFHVKDALGRTWQCGTIQLDMAQPERFDLTYEGDDGKRHRPLIIHIAIFGSVERFFGILIEHFAGKFPVWMSPVQARILTVSNKNERFAGDVKEKLEQHSIRADTDFKNESVPKKVREAQLMRIPLIITIGDKEEQSQSLAVRTLDGKVTFGVSINEFIQKALSLIKERKIVVEI